MSAQLVRMNAAASNLANAGTVAGSEDAAYRPIRAVFAEQLDSAGGGSPSSLSSVRVAGMMRETGQPIRQHDPDNPLADANGDTWAAPVDENAEMVEMTDASRQYRNLVEALSTAKQLMLDTLRSK
jgi:flagellar basal-body rod protein FlgC